MNNLIKNGRAKVIANCCVCKTFKMFLDNDGTIVVEGERVFSDEDKKVWKNVVKISCGNDHVIGLKQDGTVIAFGDNTYHQCDISEWKNVSMIQAFGCFSVGVDDDNEVLITGELGHFDDSVYKCLLQNNYSDLRHDDPFGEVENVSNSTSGDFIWRLIPNGAEIVSYVGYNDKVIVPARIENMNVVSIGVSAFENNSVAVDVVLPKTVTVIGARAFKSCLRLKSIIILYSVKDIGEDAFADSRRLHVYCPSDSFAAKYCYQNSVKYNNSFISRYVYIENGVSSLAKHDYLCVGEPIPEDTALAMSNDGIREIAKLYSDKEWKTMSINIENIFSCQSNPFDNIDSTQNLIFICFKITAKVSLLRTLEFYTYVAFKNVYYNKDGCLLYRDENPEVCLEQIKIGNHVFYGYLSGKALEEGVQKYLKKVLNGLSSEEPWKEIETADKYYDSFSKGLKEIYTDKSLLLEKLKNNGMSGEILADKIATAQCNLKKIALMYRIRGYDEEFEYTQPPIYVFRQIYDYFKDLPELQTKIIYRSLPKTKQTFKKQTVCGVTDEFFGDPVELNRILIQNQGESLFPLSGTCGLCQCANMLTIAGDSLSFEEKAISAAMEFTKNSFNVLGLFKPSADTRGGTTPWSQKELLEKFGLTTRLIPKSSNTEQSLNILYEDIITGHAVIIGVEVSVFWGAQYGGHAISLISVSKNGQYFVYNDTGRGIMGVITRDQLGRSFNRMGGPFLVSEDILV